MKKIITLAGLVWIFAHSAMADQLPVFLEYHRKITPEKNTDVNIVAIDYDASASEVNQLNRIKLMLENGREALRKED